MDNLYIPPTPSSPEVDFKFDENTLSLRGEAGDFPAPLGVTIRDLDLRPLSGASEATP